MAWRHKIEIDTGVVRVHFSDRGDGDLRPLAPENVDQAGAESWAGAVAERRTDIVDAPWTWLRQVHGARVVLATEPGEMAGSQADAVVTHRPGCPIAVSVADCAPVVLVAEGGVAVVHAGWRGLVGGVIDAAASQLRAVAGSPVAALLGPCIAASAYEFGQNDLDEAVAALGEAVRGRTAWDTPAFDVPAAVATACLRAGWPEPQGPPACTSDEKYFSHRTRLDGGRQVAVAWLVPAVAQGHEV